MLLSRHRVAIFLLKQVPKYCLAPKFHYSNTKKMSSCIFCKIISGENQAEIYYQDNEICIFRDIKPASTHHFLACPKEHIENVNSLNQSHATLVENLVRKSKELLQEKGGNTQDVLLGFHKPPFNTINHLHLHVISPESEMSWFQKIAFKRNTWWFTEVDPILSDLINRL